MANKKEPVLKVVTIRKSDNDIVIKWFTEKKGVTENDETVKDLAEASKAAKK